MRRKSASGRLRPALDFRRSRPWLPGPGLLRVLPVPWAGRRHLSSPFHFAALSRGARSSHQPRPISLLPKMFAVTVSRLAPGSSGGFALCWS